MAQADRQRRILPIDLVAVGIIALAVFVVAVVPPLRRSPLRVLLGGGVAAFGSGYAILAWLYPISLRQSDETLRVRLAAANVEDRCLEPIERVILAVTASLALTQLLWVATQVAPWFHGIDSFFIIDSTVTLVLVAVAIKVRTDLPRDDRWVTPVTVQTVVTEIRHSAVQSDERLTVALVVGCLLVSTVGIVYGLTVPISTEQPTELSLLTRDADGDLVASGYPPNFTVGQSRPLTVAVHNGNNERTEYTVSIQIQTVTGDADQTVRRRETLTQSKISVPANESITRTYDLAPTMTGRQLRIQVLLFRGDVPTQPRRKTASRAAHFWTNVTATS